jgi:hypothetical protein
MVKKELASQRMPTGELYKTIHHKKLQFSYPCQQPPPSLLRHRMHRYVHGISSKRPETKKKRKVRLLRCVCYSGRCPHLFHASVSIQLAQIEQDPRGMSFDRFEEALAAAGCSRRATEAFWREGREVVGIEEVTTAPVQTRSWVPIEGPPLRGGMATWWYNRNTGFIKWVAAETTKEAAEPVSSR